MTEQLARAVTVPAPRAPSEGSLAGPVLSGAKEHWLAGGYTSANRPVLRGWLHARTFPVSVVAGGWLVWSAQPGLPRAAAVVYAVACSLLFGVSAAYHRGSWSARAAGRLRRIDLSDIFLVIAGTYTPLVAVGMSGTVRDGLLAAVWAGALAGCGLRLWKPDAPNWIGVPLYAAVASAAVPFLPELAAVHGTAVMLLVAVGGAMSGLGGLFYALRWPGGACARWGYHEWFHLTTILSWVLLYAAIFQVVTGP